MTAYMFKATRANGTVFFFEALSMADALVFAGDDAVNVEACNSDVPAAPRIVATIGNPYQSKHLYEIGTDKGRIEVHANTRAGAAAKARREGYEVRDVNMVG